MHRLFVALRLSPSVRSQLLALMGGLPGARWQSGEQLHLTLRFIGEVDRRQAEDIAIALDRIDGPRPTLAVRGMGAFSRRGSVHTLYAGIIPDPDLLLLNKRIERGLGLAGLAPDHRTYLPHVTIARFGRHGEPCDRFIADHASLTIAPETPDAYYLYESQLGSDGASYEIIARYPLRAGQASSW